ncbi:MAG: hypothetical protein JNK93_11680, partial [Planctomycetia bacterium]|nr:hypothetical protein [Planctomycetia bacterium]
EFILVVSILIFGIIPGLVALRNSVNAALTSTGNLLGSLLPSFTFSGWVVANINGNLGQNVAQVNGYQTDYTAAETLTGDQVPPIQLPALLIVSPAP